MNKWQILVVDDDPLLLRSLQRDLLSHNYQVVTANSASEALKKIESFRPDLAVLDLMMPGMSGFDLAQQLRRHIELPVIMLTSIDDEATVVEGLERYADDYVTKPHRSSELRVRIQKLLNRVYGDGLHPSQQIVVDERLTLDFGQHAAILDGERTSLSPIESRILFMLLKRAPELVSSNALLRNAWGYGEEGDPTSLWVRIRALRQKIEPNPDNPVYIQTVRGKGYAFIKKPGRP